MSREYVAPPAPAGAEPRAWRAAGAHSIVDAVGERVRVAIDDRPAIDVYRRNDGAYVVRDLILSPVAFIAWLMTAEREIVVSRVYD